MRRILTGLVTSTVAASTIAFAPPAAALVDPHFPDPYSDWCPGGGSLFQGYCEGISYPDGTRWQRVRIYIVVAIFWAPQVCVVFTGQPLPPLAPPGGCGQR